MSCQTATATLASSSSPPGTRIRRTRHLTTRSAARGGLRERRDRAALDHGDGVALELAGQLRPRRLDQDDDARPALLLALADAHDAGQAEELAAMGGEHLGHGLASS